MKIFSTLDAAQAVVTFWICSLLLLKIDDIACHIGVVGVLAAVFTYSWRKTATIALVLTAVVVPSSVRSVCLLGYLYSVYLLYWYKSTNTDAAQNRSCGSSPPTAKRRCAASVFVLLYQ
jgi:hypothetical protein